jgi:hypothetical protein
MITHMKPKDIVNHPNREIEMQVYQISINWRVAKAVETKTADDTLSRIASEVYKELREFYDEEPYRVPLDCYSIIHQGHRKRLEAIFEKYELDEPEFIAWLDTRVSDKFIYEMFGEIGSMALEKYPNWEWVS